MAADASIRVLVVDDHHLFRAGLRSVLAGTGDLAVIGEASGSREALELLETLRPEVVTVDVSLPDGDGIWTTREIVRRAPDTVVLMLTMHGTPRYVSQALAAGARGYALKDQPPPEIVEALRAVARGERYLVPRLPPLEALAALGAGGPLAPLSARERQVFDLVVRGQSNVEVAGTLQLSVKTVETHRAHINRKLQVHSTGALVRLAAVHGLIGG